MAQYFSVAVILLARSASRFKGDEPGFNEYNGLIAGLAGYGEPLEWHEQPMKGIVAPGFGTGSCNVDKVESCLEEPGCFPTSSWDVSVDTDPVICKGISPP